MVKTTLVIAGCRVVRPGAVVGVSLVDAPPNPKSVVDGTKLVGTIVVANAVGCVAGLSSELVTNATFVAKSVSVAAVVGPGPVVVSIVTTAELGATVWSTVVSASDGVAD